MILKEDNQPPGKWRLGVITKVFPDHENNVRKVIVCTANGECGRRIVKLIPLSVEVPDTSTGGGCKDLRSRNGAGKISSMS